MKTWIKICGIRSLTIARTAIEHGVNALGFILTESPRRITPEDALAIRRTFPEEVEAVGVFRNEPLEVIQEAARFIGLDRVQLHGSVDQQAILTLSREFSVIQALSVHRDGSFDHGLLDLPAEHLLLDTTAGGQHGGTGLAFDWTILADLPRSRMIIAGGVGPENVGELVQRYHPYGIDANSRLEVAPGVKDPEMIVKLINTVRRAEGFKESK